MGIKNLKNNNLFELTIRTQWVKIKKNILKWHVTTQVLLRPMKIFYVVHFSIDGNYQNANASWSEIASIFKPKMSAAFKKKKLSGQILHNENQAFMRFL